MARQAAVSKSFDEVKSQLVARVGREKRTKEFDEPDRAAESDEGHAATPCVAFVFAGLRLRALHHCLIGARPPPGPGDPA